jgi:CsgH protein
MPYPKPAATKYMGLAAVLGVFSLVASDHIKAVAMPTNPSLGVTCQIRASDGDAGLRLEAIADATRVITGSYRLVVAKESASGSTQNDQSGSFETDGSHEQILATVVLDRSAIGHYRATLSLDWDEGHVSCSSP